MDPGEKFTHGRIMFGYFEQGASKSKVCTTDCSKYLLQASHHTIKYYSVYKIEDEVIVT